MFQRLFANGAFATHEGPLPPWPRPLDIHHTRHRPVRSRVEGRLRVILTVGGEKERYIHRQSDNKQKKKSMDNETTMQISGGNRKEKDPEQEKPMAGVGAETGRGNLVHGDSAGVAYHSGTRARYLPVRVRTVVVELVANLGVVAGVQISGEAWDRK
ncbi:predicted protein [Histoplasma mississippiense (nom. inval.)]|uniref:predicted protein n=1 Tax=Ajellomyces capsulatus (strain NAm1 / WU24) TaxID=2059318 RepID=UPI000157B810|nr:predicted protein [Histoplasma mississippiense (nom. inval.)]EDN03493.1 predicted protein [Histoplasma mississippiense (nom. inval.)]